MLSKLTCVEKINRNVIRVCSEEEGSCSCCTSEDWLNQTLTVFAVNYLRLEYIRGEGYKHCMCIFLHAYAFLSFPLRCFTTHCSFLEIVIMRVNVGGRSESSNKYQSIFLSTQAESCLQGLIMLLSEKQYPLCILKAFQQRYSESLSKSLHSLTAEMFLESSNLDIVVHDNEQLEKNICVGIWRGADSLSLKKEMFLVCVSSGVRSDCWSDWMRAGGRARLTDGSHPQVRESTTWTPKKWHRDWWSIGDIMLLIV